MLESDSVSPHWTSIMRPSVPLLCTPGDSKGNVKKDHWLVRVKNVVWLFTSVCALLYCKRVAEIYSRRLGSNPTLFPKADARRAVTVSQLMRSANPIGTSGRSGEKISYLWLAICWALQNRLTLCIPSRSKQYYDWSSNPRLEAVSRHSAKELLAGFPVTRVPCGIHLLRLILLQ